MKYITFFIVTFFVFEEVKSQVISEYLGDEGALYAETKQINQFFRRFNSEEDLKGKRLTTNSPFYRNPKYREKYINGLFDYENKRIKESLKLEFINDVIADSSQKILKIHGGEWLAEVHTEFNYLGKEKEVILYLKLEDTNPGSKWVINHVYFEPFYNLFQKDTANRINFLHPMSHELDFMNLRKAFQKGEKVENYTAKEYKPDYLTLFMYECKKANLKFKTVINVKFHFFQIDNWYFELSDFNRADYNSGWLISNLMKIPKNQKDILLRYIYREN